mgnify:CR=1 FL=1
MVMLTMIQVDSKRKMYYERGKNVSEISRMTESDRRTVISVTLPLYITLFASNNKK